MKFPILFTILLFFSSHFQQIFSNTSRNVDTDFIIRSCSTTTYPSICNEKLLPYADKVNKDHLKLCMVALTVSLEAAEKSFATVSAFAKQKGISKRDEDVIRVCTYTIKDSVDKVKKSINALSSINKSGKKRFQLDSVKTYISAAMTSEETCIDEMSDSKLNASIKKKIEAMVVNFERITSNGLSLIDSLKY